MSLSSLRAEYANRLAAADYPTPFFIGQEYLAPVFSTTPAMEPLLEKFRLYSQTPGRVAMLEMCLRDRQRPSGAHSILTAAELISRNQSLMFSDNDDVGIQFLSLIASSRKLLHGLLLPPTSSEQHQQQTQLEQEHLYMGTHSSQKGGAMAVQFPDIMTDYLRCLVITDIQRDELLQGAMRMFPHLYTEESVRAERVQPMRLRLHIMHRSVTVLLVMWLQMFRYRITTSQTPLGTSSARPKPQWLAPYMQEVRKLSKGPRDVAESIISGQFRIR